MHQIILPFFLIFYHEALTVNETKPTLIKPDFVPYCVTRDICWPDCECTTAENCAMIPMSKHTKEKILMMLNQKRDIQSRGEPVPSGMSMLIYDHQLEQLSECWAAKCENIYSECFRTEKYNETSQSVGQIVLDEHISPSPNHWIRMIDNWFGEFSSLTYEIVESLPEGDLGEKIHNFAQMLSDRVLKVGCAWSLSEITITFVCTFGPRGPNTGEAIYKTGELCTRCLEGYKCSFEKPFKKLCKKFETSAKFESTTGMISTSTFNGKRKTKEEEKEGTEPSTKLSKATQIDPDDEKNYNILWLFALGLILLILVVLIVFALFYILRLGSVASG